MSIAIGMAVPWTSRSILTGTLVVRDQNAGVDSDGDKREKYEMGT